MLTEKLKQLTAEPHLQLEQNYLLKSLISKTITPEIYVLILKKFYGYFYPLEKSLNKIPQISYYLPDVNARRKTSKLFDDLLFFDVLPEQIPFCDDLPGVATVGEAMGVLYVMEGSTLGGTLIFRNLKEVLGVSETSGASFFYGYGNETGLRWKMFQQAVIGFGNQYHAQEEVIETAKETFTKLNIWFRQDEF